MCGRSTSASTSQAHSEEATSSAVTLAPAGGRPRADSVAQAARSERAARGR
jgi:hypothetical protein